MSLNEFAIKKEVYDYRVKNQPMEGDPGSLVKHRRKNSVLNFESIVSVFHSSDIDKNN